MFDLLWPAIGLAILLQVGDLATTVKFRQLGVREGNPLIRKAQDRLGVFWGTLPFKLVGMGLILSIPHFLTGLEALAGVGFFIVLYTYVCLNNLRNIRKAKRTTK